MTSVLDLSVDSAERACEIEADRCSRSIQAGGSVQFWVARLEQALGELNAARAVLLSKLRELRRRGVATPESAESFIGSLEYQTNAQCIIEAERWKATIEGASLREGYERCLSDLRSLASSDRCDILSSNALILAWGELCKDKEGL